MKQRMGQQNKPELENLAQKTLDELRALARSAGLRGYSGLRKNQLIELLKKQEARPSADSGTSQPPAAKPAKSTPATLAGKPTATESPAMRASSTGNPSATEQRIESAKFEMGPPGAAYPTVAPAVSALHENIDQLPLLGEPTLCLLPQKPGVVHAYWTLPSGAVPKSLRLRLCRAIDDAIEMVKEIDVSAEHGHWYFQIPASMEPGSFFVQLGSYDGTGNFVTAIRRGVARIPSLYASTATDRRWWISDTEFRTLYTRTGGLVSGARLFWPGSSSSREK